MNLHATHFKPLIAMGPLIVALLGGCQSPAESSTRRPRTNLGADVRLPSDPVDTPLDFGGDWERVEASIGGQGNASRRTPVALTKASAQTGVGIALGTYTSGAHRQQAALAMQGIAKQIPDLASALSIHNDERGSMLIYGHYSSFDDPSLKVDLKRLKHYTVNGKRVFGLVMPAELRPTLNADDLNPLDLRLVRLQNPNVRVIYTLEVAWWGDYGGSAGPRDAQARAEAFASRLRRAGHEAFFLHEPHRHRSSVCVGVFDYQAVDSASGLESMPVLQTRQSFPSVLINDEPQTKPVGPRNANQGRNGKPLPPKLVDVPRL